MNSKILTALVLNATLLSLAASAQTIEVTSTGVGIGTSTPAAKLTLESALTAVPGGGMLRLGGSLDYSAQTNNVMLSVAPGVVNIDAPGISGGRLKIDASGYVGIGTTTPDSLLTTYQNGHGQVIFYGTDGLSSGSRAVFAQGSYNGVSIIGSTSNGTSRGDFAIYTADTERMRFTTGGNVGIGTTTPSNKLHVQGAGGTAGIVVSNSDTTALGWNINVDSNYSYGLNIAEYGVADGRLYIARGGNVGIGTTSPSYPLQVAGSVRATSFISNSTTYADFVFQPGYKLASLAEVESTIKAKGHLPDIPSETEAKVHGVDLGEMQVKLLQKVEELTLYLVAHEKALAAQEQRLQRLTDENAALQRKLSELTH